jgi:serine/threonine protein phosphatase PrpC
MSDVKIYIQKLLEARNLSKGSSVSNLLEEFCSDPYIIESVHLILNTQKMLINKWQIKSRIEEITHQSIVIPNGTVGKKYEAKLDFLQLAMNDLVYTEFEGLSEYGLFYDNESETIKGIPEKAGDSKIILKFRVEGEAESSVLNEKKIALVINPDPKSLWKNIDSDPQDPFWKKDNTAEFAPIGNGKHIVVASKRGRSHANVGSFRDDDFAFKFLKSTGWSVVVISDGAGSAKFSRKGSQVVCSAIVTYFEELFTAADNEAFNALIFHYLLETGEDTVRKLNHWVYHHLSKAALYAHNQLVALAKELNCDLKDLHATLSFTLFKKIEEKFVLLSFGVGDCPMAVLSSDLNKVTLLNWLDVGEFGGGTRFITMPEIFSSEKFHSRFSFKLMEDFSYLMLFTDGIYDPKFMVEANLEKIEMWQNFVQDLQGANQDNCAVNLSPDNADIAPQLSKWMDFWSIGNHDDRTLAIVF